MASQRARPGPLPGAGVPPHSRASPPLLPLSLSRASPELGAGLPSACGCCGPVLQAGRLVSCRHLFLTVLQPGKLRVGVPAGPFLGEGPRPTLQTTVFSLYVHVAERPSCLVPPYKGTAAVWMFVGPLPVLALKTECPRRGIGGWVRERWWGREGSTFRKESSLFLPAREDGVRSQQCAVRGGPPRNPSTLAP